MIKRELLELNSVLFELSKLGKTKFKYLILDNIYKIKPIVTPLLELKEKIDSIIINFETERREIIKQLGTKQGDYILIDTSDSEKVNQYNKLIQELSEKYTDELSEYGMEEKEYQNILNEICDWSIFTKISLGLFPEDGINENQLRILREFNIIDASN